MIKNKEIAKALANIEKNVPDRAAYEKLLEAGMRLLLNKQMFAKLAPPIINSDDPVKYTANGVIGIIAMLYMRSNKTAPIPSLVMAGGAILLNALDMIDESGLVKIDGAAINRATKIYINSVLPMLQITPNKLGAALGPLQGAIQDPNKLAQMRQSAGA